MKELRSELNRLQSDFDQKWSSQIRMVNPTFSQHRLLFPSG